MSLEVFPVSAIVNRQNGSSRYSKLSGHRGFSCSTCEHCAYLHDVLVAKFGPWVQLSMSLAVLLIAILHVIFMSSQKEMIWPDTLRIIAGVQDHQSVWYGAVVQFPRKTMSMNRLYSNGVARLVPNDYAHLASLVPGSARQSACPFPAVFRLQYIMPEPTGCWPSVCFEALPRTEVMLAVIRSPRINRKLSATLFAGSFHSAVS